MFNQTQSNMLDGLLIGDAYIPAKQRLLYFGQRRECREYVEYVARQLGVEVERVRDRARQPDKRTGRVYECSELRTLSHPIYAQLRERWYRDGKTLRATGRLPASTNSHPFASAGREAFPACSRVDPPGQDCCAAGPRPPRTCVDYR